MIKIKSARLHKHLELTHKIRNCANCTKHKLTLSAYEVCSEFPTQCLHFLLSQPVNDLLYLLCALNLKKVFSLHRRYTLHL